MNRPPRTWSTALRALAAACVLGWTAALSATPPAPIASPPAAGEDAGSRTAAAAAPQLAAEVPGAETLDLAGPQHAAESRGPRASGSGSGPRVKLPAGPGHALVAIARATKQPTRAADPSVAQELHWLRAGWASLHTSTPPPAHRS